MNQKKYYSGFYTRQEEYSRRNDEKNRKIAEKVEKNRGFDKQTFNIGADWALSGCSLEDAGEIANNPSFKSGFEYGLRKKRILEEENTENSEKSKTR